MKTPAPHERVRHFNADVVVHHRRVSRNIRRLCDPHPRWPLQRRPSLPWAVRRGSGPFAPPTDCQPVRAIMESRLAGDAYRGRDHGDRGVRLLGLTGSAAAFAIRARRFLKSSRSQLPPRPNGRPRTCAA